MQTRTRWISGLFILGLGAALSTGCEDSGITAPEGSAITVIASPASVDINQDSGESSGSTSIVAQLLDDRGLPLTDVPLFFSSSGGLLGSVNNVCRAGGNCSRTTETCVVDADCGFIAPAAIETDGNGIASDILTLRLVEDPDSVDVTVTSTASSTSVTVPKNVNTGPQDPVANIVAEPAGGQRTGRPFSFNGTGTSVDPQADITCWEWTIASDIANDITVRGSDISILRVPGDLPQGSFDSVNEQDLSVLLRVSDEVGVPCTNSTAPPSSAFSLFSDVISYEIRCDLTNPTVEAGANRTESLAGQANVSVTLTAIGSDPEDLTLDYTWDCGTTSQNNVPGQTVTCVYDTTTQGGSPFVARVTARNDCGLEATDSLTVAVNP